MTWWTDLLGFAWKLITGALLLLAFVAIVTQPRPGEYSGAPIEEDEGDAWDRAHDQWVDEQAGAPW